MRRISRPNEKPNFLAFEKCVGPSHSNWGEIYNVQKNEEVLDSIVNKIKAIAKCLPKRKPKSRKKVYVKVYEL